MLQMRLLLHLLLRNTLAEGAKRVDFYDEILGYWDTASLNIGREGIIYLVLFLQVNN
jgi:hypothetical protein